MKRCNPKSPKKKALTKPLIERIENFLNRYYVFRHNEVSGRVEYKTKRGKGFQLMQDYDLNTIHRSLERSGVTCSTSRLRNLVYSNYSSRFNPFIEYLNGLPKHDGGKDYIQQLADTVKTKDDKFWALCLRKWLTAMVASLLVDNIINHTVIVLSGGQGVGKTTWILSLVPDALKAYQFSGSINPDNKDTLIYLSECLLINLDELENLSKHEQGSIKEMITKSAIRVRRPYAHNSENLPRRASFAGSVNGKEFLSDTTGSRRFLCFEVTSINNAHKISLDKVFSQAKSLFESGYQYWFDAAEIKSLEKNNEEYRQLSIEEELLHKFFEPCPEQDCTHILSATEIVQYFSEHVQYNITEAGKQKIGKVLKALGFIQISRNKRYVYVLREKCRKPEFIKEANKSTSGSLAFGAN